MTTYGGQKAEEYKEELTTTYRKLDRALADMYYQLHSGKGRKDQVVIPSEENRQLLLAEYEALSAQVDRLDTPAPYFTVMKHQLKDFCDALRYELADYFNDPVRGLSAFFRQYRRLAEKGEAEWQNTQAIYGRLEEALQAVPITNAPALCRRLVSCADEIRHETYMTEEASSFMEGAAAKMQGFAEELQRHLPSEESIEVDDAVATAKMEEAEYRTLLSDLRGVELDELLLWEKTEMEKTRSECFQLANRLAKEKGEPAVTHMGQVNDLLNKYAGPCGSAEEMFARAADYMKRTRALAHQYVKLPKDEQCLIKEVPYSLRYSFPWGGYSDGDDEVRPFTGTMFLNQYNFKNVTDGWLKMNCLHEAYPGHHCQFVRNAGDPAPETVKIGAKYIPVLEGMAHRTEKAFAFIYEEDPFFELFAAYRRHHTAVRIHADLLLRYYGCTLQQATEVYMQELGFDQRTARGQVQAQLDMPGYFTCYYYGMKKLCDWEDEYGFDKKTYTELLFSFSHFSLKAFKMILDLSEEDRAHLAQDFKSLYME